jgi:hypothetical protein
MEVAHMHVALEVVASLKVILEEDPVLLKNSLFFSQ